MFYIGSYILEVCKQLGDIYMSLETLIFIFNPNILSI